VSVVQAAQAASRLMLLARHSRVDKKTNKYIKPQSAVAVYSTMTWVRSVIVCNPLYACD
jgi:hypothetical protein